MRTPHRRLLGLLPLLGVKVLSLGKGAAVLTRRKNLARHPLTPGVDLLSRPGATCQVTQAGTDTWVVSTERKDAIGPFVKSLRQHLPQGRWRSHSLRNTGAHVVADQHTLTTGERAFQVAAADFLCSVHVAAMMEHYRVNCVFDVGANSGQYAKELRKRGYKGRIVSFEPVPHYFERLQKAAANDPDWIVHPFALGSEDAVQSMHVDWKTMNSLLSPSDYGQSRYQRFTESRTTEIQVRRLDGVIDEALEGIDNPRPYLKMDTQGYDLQVFRGAGERMAEFLGLQSELAVLRLYEGSPQMREALAVYEGEGFEITGMYPVTREPATGRVVEFDCVMMRPEAAPRHRPGDGADTRRSSAST